MSHAKTPHPARQTRNNVPLYEQVKDYILGKINSGAWRPGMKIDSEMELVASIGASRMTVNRALRELADAGRITRRQGRGSFVAEQKSTIPLLEIRSIASEIKGRGGDYSCTVHLLQEEKARPDLARALQLPPYSAVYHSVLVHKEDNVPVQLSSRFINPAIAPDYLKQDFTRITPNEYLLGLAPVSGVEHRVEAQIPEHWIRTLLEVSDSEPCLVVYRQTWVGNQPATASVFYYPGSRYSLTSRFCGESNVSICIS